jgi:hypothetical protein
MKYMVHVRLPPLGCKSQKFGLEGWGDPNEANIAGNRKFEVMWYMGLKKGPIHKVCAWCFAFFGPLGVFLVTLARYYPLDMYHMKRPHRRRDRPPPPHAFDALVCVWPQAIHLGAHTTAH